MPEIVATAVSTFFFPTAAGAASVAYAATYIATTAAIAYGTNALAQEAANRDNPGQLLDTQVASDAPRQAIIGVRGTAGSRIGLYVSGAGNGHLIEVIALADHRCDGCLEYMANGIVTAVNLVHGVRTPIADYRSGGDRLWVTWYDGRQGQTADAYLVGQTLTNQPDWTSAHRGRGVSYAIVEMWWDDDVMLTPVNSTFTMKGGLWYDRREDDTAGGSGDQRWSDPDSWTYTNNPDVFADHYQLGVVPYTGANIFSWGVGLQTWQLPYDLFAEEADISDEQVLKKDGVTYQDRYRLNAIFDATDTHRDILIKCARAKAGQVIDRGGRLAIIGPQARTSVMTLNDEDVISREQSKYSDKLSVSDLFNRFRGTFPDPTNNFRPIEFPQLTDPDWVTEDGGDDLPEDVDVDVDTDVERVQRLVWLHAQDRRRQARLTEVYGPWAMEIEKGDWFERQGARFPDGKLFECIRIEYVISETKGMTVLMTSKEVDPDDVAWTADKAADLSAPPAPTQEVGFIDMDAPVLSVAPVAVTGGGATLPGIAVVVTNADDLRIRTMLVEIVQDGGGVIAQGLIEAGPASVNGATYTEGLAPDVDYVVRARFQGLVKPSEWSTNYNVTTGADLIATEAVTAGEADSVAPGSIVEASFASGVTPVKYGSALPSTGNYEGRTFFLTTDGKIYRYHSGAWTTSAAAADITGQLATAQIADGAIDNNKLGAGAVTLPAFASGLRPIESVSSLPVTGNTEGRTVLLSTDGNIYRYTSGAYTKAVAAADITGQVTNSQIADMAAAKLTGQITTTQITDDAVTTPKIFAGSVTTAKVAALAITAAKIALVDLENLLTDPLIADSTIWSFAGGAAASTNAAITGNLNAPSGVTFLGTGQTSGTNGTATVGSSYYARAEGGKNYRFSVRRRVVTGFTGRLLLQVQWFDQSKTIIGTSSTVASDTDYRTVAAAADATAPLDAQAAAPSNAAYVRFLLTVQWSSTLTNAGNIYAADPKLNRAQGAELIVDGAITTVKLAALAVTANELAANAVTAGKVAALAISTSNLQALAVTASKVLIGDASNMLADNFADSAAWSPAGAVYTFMTGASAPADMATLEAQYAIKTEVGNGTTTQAAQSLSPASSGMYPQIEPLKNYRLQIRTMVKSGFTGQLRFRYAWYGTDSGTGAVVQVGSTLSVLGTSYLTSAAGADAVQDLSVDVTAPAGANRLLIQPFNAWSTTLSNAQFGYFAHPRIYRRDAGELTVDGSITATKVGALAITAAKIAVVDLTNLVPDPLITDTTNLWTLGAGAAVSTNSQITGNLNASSGATFTGTGQTSAADGFAMGVANYYPRVEGGKTYRAFVRRRVAVGFTGRLILMVQWYDQSKTIISTTNVVLDTDYRTVAAAAAATVPLDGQAVAPSNAAYANYRLAVAWSSTLTNAGVMYVGDPKLLRASSAELIVDGSILTQHLSANSVTTAKLAANAITANELAANSVIAGKVAAAAIGTTELRANSVTVSKLYVGGDSLCQDSLFMDAAFWANTIFTVGTVAIAASTAGWYFENNAGGDLKQRTIATIWAVRAGPDYSKVHILSPFWPGTASTMPNWLMPVNGGRVYELGASIHNNSNQVSNLAVSWFKQDGSSTGSALATSSAAGSLLQTLRVQGTAPSDAAYAQVTIYNNGGSTLTGIIKASGVTFREAAAGTMIVDGSITATKITVTSLSALSANLGAITAGTIALTAGGRVLYEGAGFGVSSDLVFWFGPSTTAMSAATKINGYFAMGTDGVVYYGAAALSTQTAYSGTHNGPASGHRTGAGFVGSSTVTITPVNGTAPFYYRYTTLENPHAITVNAVDGTGNNTFSISATITAGVTWKVNVACDITDAIGRTFRVTVYDNVLYDDT